MQFEERYNEELDRISPSKALNEKILESNTKKERNVINMAKWKIALGACACVAVVGIAANFNSIVSFAESLFRPYSLLVGEEGEEGEEIELADVEIFEIDYEGFKNDPATRYDGVSASRGFRTSKDLEEKVGIDMLNLEGFEHEGIEINIDEETRIMSISTEIRYEEQAFSFWGLGAIQGFGKYSTGFAVDGNVVEVYEYAEGKKAYIVQDVDEDQLGRTGIYFSENGITYSLDLVTYLQDDKTIEFCKGLFDEIIKANK